jgi:hypothetical protein
MLHRDTSKTIWCRIELKTIDKRNLPPKLEVTNEDKVIVRFDEPWIKMVRVKHSRTSP